MARYDPTHKEETRKAILKAAARAIRAGGPERAEATLKDGQGRLPALATSTLRDFQR